MLIGGKPAANESKRSSKKRLNNNNNKEDASASKAQNPLISQGDAVVHTNVNAVASAESKSSTNQQTTANSATTQENEQKSTANNNGSDVNHAAGSNATAAAAASSNGINKKIPKHKWRPLQIDLAKSSRPKPLHRNNRRSGPRYQGRDNERSERRSYQSQQHQQPTSNAGSAVNNNNTSNAANNNSKSAETQQERNKQTGSSNNERIDSWRSSSGADGNQRDYERSNRPQRRFRTSHRGGRQGRGGFTRSGPGRTANRIPRHLLTNGEYASFLPADAAGTEQSFVLMGTHYYGPVPAAYIEMDAQTIKEAIKKQM